jgi:hypothetical protein
VEEEEERCGMQLTTVVINYTLQPTHIRSSDIYCLQKYCDGTAPQRQHQSNAEMLPNATSNGKDSIAAKTLSPQH